MNSNKISKIKVVLLCYVNMKITFLLLHIPKSPPWFEYTTCSYTNIKYTYKVYQTHKKHPW